MIRRKRYVCTCGASTLHEPFVDPKGEKFLLSCLCGGEMKLDPIRRGFFCPNNLSISQKTKFISNVLRILNVPYNKALITLQELKNND